MSEKELRSIPFIRDAIKGRRTKKEVAEVLGITSRTVARMKARMKKGGAKALVHRSRGAPGLRRIPAKERKKIARIIQETMTDFTPSFAAEKLGEDFGITRDRKTIAKIMRGLGLLTTKNKRSVPVVHREWREPKASLGILVQFDGSYEAWLEDRFTHADGSHELCILAAIDDATGTLLHAEFAAHEGVLPVMGFWREYSEEYGLPESIYLDKFSTYKMHLAIAAENHDTKPQFARAMQELGVTLHFANSPQAKGRVERLFRTLQDRLVKELRLAKIDTPDAANEFLKKRFLPAFNRRFARRPKTAGDRHRALSADQRTRLPEIFSRRDIRTLRNDFTISHAAMWYQLHQTTGLALRPKEAVAVHTYPDGTVALFVRGKPVRFNHLPQHTQRKTTFATKNGVVRIPTLAPAH